MADTPSTASTPGAAALPEEIQPFFDSIPDPAHRERARTILEWVSETFPELTAAYKWKQPMFMLGPTFIIGFSAASKHMAFAGEQHTMELFHDRLVAADLNPTKMLARIGWEAPVPYDLLAEIIEYNMETKRGFTTFWRPKEG